MRASFVRRGAVVAMFAIPIYAASTAEADPPRPTPEIPAAAPTRPAPRRPATPQLPAPVCAQPGNGTPVPWLVDRRCECAPTTNADERDECAFEQGILGCYKTVFPDMSCGAPPARPRVIDRREGNGRTWVMLDFTQLTCPQLDGLRQCLTALIDGHGGPSGRSYRAFPVNATFRDACSLTPARCGGDPPYFLVFDPCGSRSCINQ